MDNRSAKSTFWYVIGWLVGLTVFVWFLGLVITALGR